MARGQFSLIIGQGLLNGLEEWERFCFAQAAARKQKGENDWRLSSMKAGQLRSYQLVEMVSFWEDDQQG